MMENPLPNTADLDDLLDRLFVLSYDQKEEILAVEQQLYTQIAKQPNDVRGLIVLMQAQQMLGNRAKAVSLANKIWETGGQIPAFYEMLYTEGLLNLGLLEMAAVLLKPRFENLQMSIEDFYPVLIKFAVMTGNVSLINRLRDFPQAADDQILFDFADFYLAEHLSDAFKNLQKMVLENLRDRLLAYEYNLDDSEGFPELDITVYTAAPAEANSELEDQIDVKISAFYASLDRKRLYNYFVSVSAISEHPAWDEEPEEDRPDAAPEITDW